MLTKSKVNFTAKNCKTRYALETKD
jgi:hypothetical protein